MITMDIDIILEGLERAIEDHRTVKGIGAACDIPENSITQFRTKPAHPLGKPNRDKLGNWLQKQGYIESNSDPIEDSIGFLRKALEFAEKRNEPRGKRAAVLIELLALVERHFAAELRELPDIQWSVPSKTKSKRFKAYPRDLVALWVEALRKHRPRAAAVAEWVAATGWRISDALDFRAGEIDLTRGVIDRDQIKTDAALPYPLTPALRAMVLTALQGRNKPDDDEHVFLDHRGRPWDYQQLVKLIDYFHKSKRWDGPAINFRDLRKSFGTSLAMDGCPPNVLKELMGHTKVETTLGFYVAVDLEKMAEWSQRHAPLKTQAPPGPPVSPAEDSQ